MVVASLQVPLGATSSKEHMKFILTKAEVSVLVCSSTTSKELVKILADCPSIRIVILMDIALNCVEVTTIIMTMMIIEFVRVYTKVSSCIAMSLFKRKLPSKSSFKTAGRDLLAYTPESTMHEVDPFFCACWHKMGVPGMFFFWFLSNLCRVKQRRRCCCRVQEKVQFWHSPKLAI